VLSEHYFAIKLVLTAILSIPAVAELNSEKFRFSVN